MGNRVPGIRWDTDALTDRIMKWDNCSGCQKCKVEVEKPVEEVEVPGLSAIEVGTMAGEDVVGYDVEWGADKFPIEV